MACLLALTAEADTDAVQAVTGPKGRIRSLRVGAVSMPLRSNLLVPSVGWQRQPGLQDARIESVETNGRDRAWSGAIDVGDGQVYRFEHSVAEVPGGVVVTATVTAGAEALTDGVYLVIDVPVRLLRGGQATCDGPRGPPATVSLPVRVPAGTAVLLKHDEQTELLLRDADGRTGLAFTFDPPAIVTLQDERRWHNQDYRLLARFAEGRMAEGDTASIRMTVTPTVRSTTVPALLAIDAEARGEPFAGAGGNYCFATDSPVADYTLAHLNVAQGRVRMALRCWEPENDDITPDTTAWENLTANDRPDSELRSNLLMAQRLQERGIPYAMSVWWAPEWMLSQRGPDSGERGGVVARERWMELVECITTYLLYARREYGVEPDLFSFNEPDLALFVYFTPEDYGDFMSVLAPRLENLGLKTRVLLGEVANAGRIDFVGAAAANPYLMRWVDAVSFHSWGGASPDGYRAWRELADRMGVSLVVGEVGVDADYASRPHEQPGYGLEELRMYQELLMYARPGALLQWQFSDDYSLVGRATAGTDETVLVPTDRFYFVKHFCDLTPIGSRGLGTASTSEDILVTAFLEESGRSRRFACHIANLGRRRSAAVVGIPAGISRLRSVVTGGDVRYQWQAPKRVRCGALELELPAESLVTLMGTVRR